MLLNRISYLTLFIFAHMFLVILCYDALRLKNTIQVIGICIFNGAMLVYAAIQMDQIKDANTALRELGVTTEMVEKGGDPNVKGALETNIWPYIQPSLIAIPCIIALSTILMCVVCWKLYDEFAWTIYKHISADLRMRKRYLTFQVCRCINWCNSMMVTDNIAWIIDFHCFAQIRFLLLCRIYSPIYRHCRLNHQLCHETD
jgi:hypothetical protein